MTPGQLREKAKRHFGKEWANEVSPIVGYAPDTIRKWSQKCTTIPERAASAFQAWEVEQKNIAPGSSQNLLETAR